MKKYLIVFTCFMLTACNFTVEEMLLLPTQAPTNAKSVLATQTLPPTSTLTLTPTFTSTPTPVGGDLPTATLIEFTETPPLVFSEITPNTPTPTISIAGFTAINISAGAFYDGAGCEPQTIKITAQAADAAGTAFVVLFVRFKSKTTDGVGDWTSIAMNPLGAGTFVYELKADDIKNKDLFKEPWVEYQLVATGPGGVKINGTDVFSQRIALLKCLPTPTPTIFVTDTPLRP